MSSTEQNLQKIHRLIRDEGRLDLARPLVLSFSARRLSREQRLRLASYAHYVGLPQVTLRTLHRSVRHVRGAEPPGSEELFHYGRALIGLGALHEGTSILSRVDQTRVPDAVLSLAYAKFERWDWKGALPELRAAMTREADFSRNARIYLYGRLGEALLEGTEDPTEAVKALQEGLKIAGTERHLRPRMYLLRLLAGARLRLGQWDEAARRIDERDALFSDVEDKAFKLGSRKMRTLLEMARGSEPAKLLPELDRIRLALLKSEDWNNARDCDFQALRLVKEQDRLERFYFGTPFPAARERVLRELGIKETDLPESYSLELQAPGKGEPVRIELLDGAREGSRARLKPGQTLQRLFHTLAADFYTRPNLLILHERAYPGENFNPASSPVKLSQALRRLRLWFKSAKLPLRVDEHAGRYELATSRPVTIGVRVTEAGSTGPQLLALELAMKGHRAQTFAAGDVEKRLKLKRSSAVALLRTAISEGRIERVGSGPGTRYRLKT